MVSLDAQRRRQMALFVALAAFGLLASYLHVPIPHTDALIDGRWAFGFVGFAMLARWRSAALLTVVLSLPLGSEIDFLTGLVGNLLYAVPCLLVIRPLHQSLLGRLGFSWGYAVGWVVLVLLCYQVFITPAVWAVLAGLDGRSVVAGVAEGWRTQPFGVESVLVALFSAVIMVALLAHHRLRQGQRRLDHIYRVLLGIRNVNQLIVAENDTQRLIDRACVNLTETMGYLNAWIALLADDRQVVATASSGFNGEFELLVAQWAQGQMPSCMAGALASGEVAVVKNPPVECADCPLSAAYGGRAGLARRLEHEGKVYGVLAVSVPGAYAGDDEEQSLFIEVAGDLGFALHKIEVARRLEQTTTMLARTEQIAHIGSWEWDVATDQVRWSEELFRIFSRDPAAGAPSYAEHPGIYVAEDMARLEAAVERCLTDGTPYSLDLRAIRADGEIRHCLASGQAERAPDGRVHRLVGSLQDVTERKRLDDRTALLSQMLDAAPASITVHDTAGRFLYANRITVAQHGYADEAEFLALNLRDLDVPESAELVAERMREIAANGEARFEVAHYRKDGTTFPLEVQVKVIEWDGQPAMLSVATDITERRAMETQNRIFADIIARCQDFIGVATPDQKAFFVNPAGREMVGLESEAAAAATSIRDYFLPEDLPVVEETIVPTVLAEGRWSGEFRFRHFVTGEPVPVLYDLFLTEDPVTGEPTNLTTVTREISDLKRADEALRASETELQRQNAIISTLLDHLSVGVFMVEAPSGRPLVANLAAQQLLGRGIQPDASAESLAEVYQARKLSTGEPYPADEMPVVRAMAGESTMVDDLVVVRPDGSEVLLEITGAPITDEQGNIWAGLVSFQDITERRRAEEALRDSEERYRLLADLTMEGIVIHKNAVAIDVNASLARMMGRSREGLLHQNFMEFVHPDDHALVRRNIVRDYAAPYEIRMVRADGEYVWVEIEARNFQWEGDTWRVSAIRDITERRQAEAALRESEARLRESQRTGRIGHVEFNVESGEILWAEMVYELYERAPALGPPSYDEVMSLHHPEDAARLAELVQHAIATGEPYAIDLRANLPSGRPAMFHAIGTPLVDETGRVTRVTGTVQDITVRKQVEAALRESEEQHRSLIQHLHAGVVVHGPDTRITLANDQACEMLGLTMEQLTGKHAIDPAWCFVNDDGSAMVPEEYPVSRVLATRAPIADLVVGICRPATNDFRWGLVNAFPDLAADGTVQQVVVTFLDITERQQAEEALRESEARFATAFRSSPAPLVISEIDTGLFHDVNDRWVEMLEYSREEQIGRTSKEVGIWDDPSERDRLVAMVGEAGAFRDEPIRFRTKSGKVISALWSTEVITIGGRDLMLSMITDITELKRTEEELRRREHQLQRIFEILPIGLWFADKEGTLLRGNPAGIAIWGAEPKVPIGEYGVFKAWWLPSREPIQADEWALARTIREGVTIVDELIEIEAFDGRRKTVLNYCAPILDGDGNLDGAIVVNLDISDRQHLEEQLRQAQKMESVGRLAGGVAHDFNNMLNVILGHATLMLEDLPDDSPLREDLDEIRRAAERSADLTRQLLAFARKQTVAPVVLDLNETVEGGLKMLSRLIGEDIELVWRPGEALSSVRIDPAQVDQILANLAVNARDAISPGVGRIVIETAAVTFDAEACESYAGCQPGEYVQLAVSDTGCGMDAETQASIFEPFFTTKGLGEGTGLGLATVFGIVQQNHGFINVYSERGHGTTFRVYLPAHQAGVTSATADAPVAVPVEPGHETVLLVEDEPAILALATRMLRRQGYHVLTAATPGEAMRLAREHAGEIHLLMTDVIMPEMNGRELARNLLALYPDLKRLFMSGYTAEVIAHQGVLEEGVQFLQKPFSQADMLARVRQALTD